MMPTTTPFSATSTNSVASLHGAYTRLLTRAPESEAEILTALLQGLDGREIEEYRTDFPSFAHPHQRPPQGDWTTWLILGGRGAGKTRAGAEWVRGVAAD